MRERRHTFEPPENPSPLCVVNGCFDDGIIYVDAAPLSGMCCRLHANALRLGELREGQAGPGDQAGPSTSQ